MRGDVNTIRGNILLRITVRAPSGAGYQRGSQSSLQVMSCNAVL